MPDHIIETGTKESCKCKICKSYCRNCTGWFKYGETELVAAFLNVSLDTLFKTKLGVDWLVGDEEDEIFVLAPATKNIIPGDMFPGDPRGECIFFNDKELCEIHKVKPYECREAIHGMKSTGRLESVAKSWVNHQDQIKKLLGRKPKAAFFNPFGIFCFAVL